MSGSVTNRRRRWHPTPVLLPGKSHGWRSLVGYGVSKSRTWLSDFTFTLHFHALQKDMASHSSVLAWRIPGTEKPCGLLSMGLQSRTWLKRLSSGSSSNDIFYTKRSVKCSHFFLFILVFFLLKINQFPTYFLSQMPEKCLRELILST